MLLKSAVKISYGDLLLRILILKDFVGNVVCSLYMSSFKETRDFILLSYDIHLTNDEDSLVL